MSVRKSSHGTIFLIVSSGSPLALIDSSLRSTSKNPFCPMSRSLHPPHYSKWSTSQIRADLARGIFRGALYHELVWRFRADCLILQHFAIQSVCAQGVTAILGRVELEPKPTA